MNQIDTIKAAAAELRSRISGAEPVVGIILGSGLGRLADMIEDKTVIPYTELPGFPKATAIGHKGNYIVGKLGGKCVIAMQGRIHYYEGYPMEIVTLPTRVMICLGIKYLFVSNAAGGLNPGFSIGDMMVIKDHINLIPNPLVGPNADEFGPRFPDMTRPYDPTLISKTKAKAAELGISLQEGVYLACTGPCYETPAEIRYMRMIGADAVGMSTTPEVIVARHSSIPVFGVSVITDVTHDLAEDYVTDEQEIIRAADRASEKMTTLFTSVISEL